MKRPGIHPGRCPYSHLFLAAPLSAATALPSTTLTTASSLLPATAALTSPSLTSATALLSAA